MFKHKGQFRTVLCQEYLNVMKSKAFCGFLIVVTALIAGALLVIPFLFKDDAKPTNSEPSGSKKVLAVADPQGVFDREEMAAVFTSYTLEFSEEISDVSREKLKADIAAGTIESAILVQSPLSITYISGGSMFDSVPQILVEYAQTHYRVTQMAAHGMTEAQIAEAMQPPVIQNEVVGKESATHYAGTYAMLMILYLSIVMFGQMVATAVVTEKSSRAMELLITSATPRNLMFGKILGVGLAGLTQISAWLLAGVIGLTVHLDYYRKLDFVSSVLESGPELIVFLIVFFCLGYFMFAAIYGAVGSLVSRTEDVGIVSMPVMLVFMAGFMVAMIGMATPDALIVRIFSLIPVFTPMCMFVRVSMSVVPPWELALALTLTLATTVFMAWLSARIYRIGVLLYGKPPSVKELFKALRADKKY